MSAAIVLAAGEGRRFGGGPKQLAEVRGRPLIEHALAAVRTVGRTVVVLGSRAEEIRAGADLRDAEVTVFAGWEEGMGASLRHGLSVLGEADEVVIVLADQPFITSAVVARVRATPGPAVRAVYAGAPGHPVVIRGEGGGGLLARAGELRGDSGFRALLDGVVEVECGDLADPRDIDTRADLEVMRR